MVDIATSHIRLVLKGSGKTSFLNLLCNCSLIQELGSKFDENAFAKLKNFHKLEFENAGSKKMESKTSGVTLYIRRECWRAKSGNH